MNEKEKNPESQDELAWEAFRYVADEMTEDQCFTFEETLFTDQTARETVAEVVELTQAIATTQSELSADANTVTPSSTVKTEELSVSRSWLAPVQWMVVGAAVCLMIVGSLQFLTSSNSTTEELATEFSADETALLAFQEGNAMHRAIALPEEADEGSSLEENEELVDQINVPAWLLSAVSTDAMDIPEE